MKTHYKKELVIKNEQKRRGPSNNRKDVMKIQSWLTLFAIWNANSGTATDVDGDFGPATEKAVKNFQLANGLEATGTVDQTLFDVLTANMKHAFEAPLASTNLRELIVEVSENHVANHPYELQIKGAWNSGPWVRSYMDGHDGAPWFWCMGFVQAVLAQATASMGKTFKPLMPLTYSCDVAGTKGLEKGALIRYTKIRRDSQLIQPGDIFLIQRSKFDWVHTGIITGIDGDVIETIEGNTNLAGSRNGIAVMKRMRNFKQSKIDILSVNSLV